MATNTKIEWTSATWNPIRGCSVVSPGCKNCYAMKQAHRFSGPGGAYEGLTRLTSNGPVWTGKVQFALEHLNDPLKWKEPRRVFVNSMSDLFHDDVPPMWVRMIFDVMEKCPQHTFQVLTKRPARMLDMLTDNSLFCRYYDGEAKKFAPRIIPNLWLGVSCENQKYADERIPLLLQTPAAVRWVSAEPLLGPINLTWLGHDGDGVIDCLRGEDWIETWDNDDGSKRTRTVVNRRPHLDWLVVGGESGPHARPMHPAWARSLRDQCQAAGVPFFFKQWGEWCPYQPSLHGSYKKKRFMHYDGRVIGAMEPNPDGMDVRDWAAITRVGKTKAGRLLDGKEWSEYPNV